MTAEQFDDAVAAFPRLSETGKSAARSVLVDGLRQSSVAATLNISRQQVNLWVRDIDASHLGCPEGWQIEVVMLPPKLMDKVREMEAQSIKLLKGSKSKS